MKGGDIYYVAYKKITVSSFFLYSLNKSVSHCHSCVRFTIKSMSICDDQVSYDEGLMYVVTCRRLDITYVVRIQVEFLPIYERS